VRVIVALLTLTLTGPSVGALVCDWACAARHQRTEALGSCHQHNTAGMTPTVAAGHVCHDLTSGPSSILTDARQAGFSAPAIVEAPLTLFVESASPVTSRVSDSSPAPPSSTLIPLRI
jgi:hypothetical protein